MSPHNASERPKIARYAVDIVPIETIKPSPENDEIYGQIQHDEQMDALIESIVSSDLEEPIIISSDGFIISGHRRFYACNYLGIDQIPVRRKRISRLDNLMN